MGIGSLAARSPSLSGPEEKISAGRTPQRQDPFPRAPAAQLENDPEAERRSACRKAVWRRGVTNRQMLAWGAAHKKTAGSPRPFFLQLCP